MTIIRLIGAQVARFLRWGFAPPMPPPVPAGVAWAKLGFGFLVAGVPTILVAWALATVLP